jgi:hypothetical protein
MLIYDFEAGTVQLIQRCITRIWPNRSKSGPTSSVFLFHTTSPIRHNHLTHRSSMETAQNLSDIRLWAWDILFRSTRLMTWHGFVFLKHVQEAAQRVFRAPPPQRLRLLVPPMLIRLLQLVRVQQHQVAVLLHVMVNVEARDGQVVRAVNPVLLALLAMLGTLR